MVYRVALIAAFAVASLAFLRLQGIDPALAAPVFQEGNGNDNLSPTNQVPVAAGPLEGSGVCALPGQQTVVTSPDGRVAVRFFPTLARAVRLSITGVTATDVAAVPGRRVGDLTVWLRAEYCDGGELSVLPVEVNLGMHYGDQDVAAGLTEQNFVISRLDPATNQWTQAAKQAADPSANYVSASIGELGIYALHQK
jgi:hypothetical protein